MTIGKKFVLNGAFLMMLMGTLGVVSLLPFGDWRNQLT